MKRCITITIILSLLGAYSCGQKSTEWRGSIEVVDGVTIVKNPKEPFHKKTNFKLEEDLTIGEAEGAEEYMFSRLRSIAVDGEGNIYAADDKDITLKVFDKDGKFLRKISREGQGPGEIGRPYHLQITADSELMVSDGRNRKIHFFSLDGEHLRSKNLKTVFPLELYAASMQNYYVLNPVRLPTGTRFDIVRLDEDMNVVLTLKQYAMPPPSDTYRPFAPFFSFKVMANDNILYGDSKDYELQIISPDGRIVKKISRAYDPNPLSDTDKDYVRRNMPEDQKLEFPSHHAAFYGFFLDDAGRIYVKTWLEQTDTVQYRCDVFDQEGKFIAQIPLSIDPQVWKGGRVYAIEEDEEGFHQIKRYKVIWDLDNWR